MSIDRDDYIEKYSDYITINHKIDEITKKVFKEGKV